LSRAVLKIWWLLDFVQKHKWRKARRFGRESQSNRPLITRMDANILSIRLTSKIYFRVIRVIRGQALSSIGIVQSPWLAVATRADKIVLYV
jgi:hypothetical protein